MIILILVLLGLCLGSFVNALVWRTYKQSKSKKRTAKYSISKGRSMCVSCGHTLSWKDLLPVFSWLALKGKCRYCHKNISVQYPLVEILTALLFVISYLFWPSAIHGLEWLVFGSWLAILTGLIALAVYDMRWMVLPDRVVFPLYFAGGFFVLIKLIQSGQDWPNLAFSALIAIMIGGGLFYVLFQISGGKWIGGGDVKLGFLLGALAMSAEKSMVMLFLASLMGCLYIIPSMLAKKTNKQSRIPFGPFLITGCIIVVLFGQTLINWYLDKVLML